MFCQFHRLSIRSRTLLFRSTSTHATPVSPHDFETYLNHAGITSRSLLTQCYCYNSVTQRWHSRQQGVYPIAVALSGGADSMALMLLLKEYMDRAQVETPLLAMTVDHQLRKESLDEAIHVGEICTNIWGVKHVIKTLEWGKNGGCIAPQKSKLQEAARTQRYAALIQGCHEYGVQHLFVAHNRGDQQETVLFRLGRSSGLSGLAGIAASSSLSTGVQLVRPLLKVSKPSMKATCLRFGQNWVEDPSNESLLFDRIRIRTELNRLESRRSGHVMELVDAFQLAAVRAKYDCEVAAQRLRNRHVLSFEPHRIIVSTALLDDPCSFDELVIRVLTELVQAMSHKDKPPRLSSVQRLLHDLKSLRNGKKITLNGCCITKKSKGLELIFEHENYQ